MPNYLKTKIQDALLEWMKTRELATTQQAEIFIQTAVAGMDKLTFEIEARRKETCEVQESV